MLTDIDSAFLKEYGEYIVGIPACILALWFAYFIYHLQKNTKSLTYQVLSNYRLIVDNKYHEQLKIHFQDEQLENVNLFVIKFKNSGNIPIEKEDFEKPIKVFFESGSKILTCEVVQQEPYNIGVEVVPDTNQIGISPCLLNQGDYFSIKLLISGEKYSNYAIDARVSGVKEISTLPPKNLSVEMLLLAFFSALFFSIFEMLELFDKKTILEKFVILGFILCLSIMAMSLVVPRVRWYQND